MIKHDGVCVSVSCLGHDSDECALQAIRKFRSEPRRAGKHKWQVIWCSMAVSDASDRPEQSASNLSGRGSSMDPYVDWCVFDRARAGLSVLLHGMTALS